ncbi:MAG: hypothetical protein WB797_03190 [Nocardioides sp.]
MSYTVLLLVISMVGEDEPPRGGAGVPARGSHELETRELERISRSQRGWCGSAAERLVG